jgi:hypothetical protein
MESMSEVIKGKTYELSGDTAAAVCGGAHDWNRTSDLFLTKEVLYRLSYMSTKTQRRVQWSGRRESNPHHQLGRLRFYH